MIPGEMLVEPGDIELNVGRATASVTVANSGDRPIQVGSHFHFFETNPALIFERQIGYGMRLNIAAGTAVRFEPGQQHSARDIAAFVSERDVVQLLACCITAWVAPGYHVVHGVSDNRYKRLAIDATRKLVGYAPQDDGFMLLGL